MSASRTTPEPCGMSAGSKTACTGLPETLYDVGAASAENTSMGGAGGRRQPPRLPAARLALKPARQEEPSLRPIHPQQVDVRHARSLAAGQLQRARNAQQHVPEQGSLRPKHQPPKLARRLPRLKLARQIRLVWPIPRRRRVDLDLVDDAAADR